MTLETTDPRAQPQAGRAGRNTVHRNHSTSATRLNGFACCFCGCWHLWSGLGAFDPPRRLKWCDTCADLYERLCNPPIFLEGEL